MVGILVLVCLLSCLSVSKTGLTSVCNIPVRGTEGKQVAGWIGSDEISSGHQMSSDGATDRIYQS